MMTLFLLFIFLYANIAFGQLVRLPTLVHHYWEHVEWDNNPSIVDFLKQHYAKEINHSDDKHNDHENLPFKAMEVQSTHVITIVPSLSHSLSLHPEAVAIKQAIYKKLYISNAYLSSIWQPPRFS